MGFFLTSKYLNIKKSLIFSYSFTKLFLKKLNSDINFGLEKKNLKTSQFLCNFYYHLIKNQNLRRRTKTLICQNFHKKNS